MPDCSDLPSIFGRQSSYRTRDDGQHVLTVVIFPCEDLFITDATEIEINFPSHSQYSTSEVTIRSLQPEIFRDCMYFSPANNLLTFPWLQSAIEYPIAVWFYAVRQLLKKGKRSAWRTPVLIKSSFQDNKQLLISYGLVELEEDPIISPGITSCITDFITLHLIISVSYLSILSLHQISTSYICVLYLYHISVFYICVLSLSPIYYALDSRLKCLRKQIRNFRILTFTLFSVLCRVLH